MQYLDENYIKVVFTKVTIAAVLIGIMILISNNLSIQLNIIQYCIILIVMLVGFGAHNLIRNRLNIITFIVLVLCKFSFAIILLIPVYEWSLPLLAIILVFPLPRIIENICSDKFEFISLKKTIGSYDAFRVKYLSIVLIILLFLHEVYFLNITLLLYLTIYFLLYRIASLLLVIMKIHTR
jgi:hypothetical protein